MHVVMRAFECQRSQAISTGIGPRYLNVLKRNSHRHRKSASTLTFHRRPTARNQSFLDLESGIVTRTEAWVTIGRTSSEVVNRKEAGSDKPTTISSTARVRTDQRSDIARCAQYRGVDAPFEWGGGKDVR